MVEYSTQNDVAACIAKLGDNPLIVNDMDGNILTGFTLNSGHSLPLKPADDPKRQSIPFGTSPEQIKNYVAQGILREGLFADKAMDARLPEELVKRINQNIENENPYALALLTSRSAEDAVIVLRESGVTHPEKVTLVADSGATLYQNGQKISVRSLNADEAQFLDHITGQGKAYHAVVKQVLSAQGFDADSCPDLYMERKGIATNIHYRGVLAAYGQPDGSELDKAIGEALKEKMVSTVQDGPKDSNNKPVFKTLDGPATVEVKVAEINKGHGLEALIKAATAAGRKPSGVAFTGDDVSKLSNGKGAPGTDYFAMVRAKELTELYDIPVVNIHTHHPEGGLLDGQVPEKTRDPALLAKEYAQPVITLRLPTPRHTVAFIAEALPLAASPVLPHKQSRKVDVPKNGL